MTKSMNNTDVKNEETLFANYDEFQKAAAFVYQHFLAKPYLNGLSGDKWISQRTIAQLSDGSVISVDYQYIIGLSEAVELTEAKKAKGDNSLVTLEEIVEHYNKNHKKHIQKEDIGKVKIQKLQETLKGRNVVKLIHRPNHNISHSMRVAAYIPTLDQLVNTGRKLPSNHVEKLQLMMLFSVLGREDETGFSDSTKKGINLYQSYRAADGLDFIEYCLANWESHYKNVFKDKNDLYQAALIVELMGYRAIPDLTKAKPTPSVFILMRGYSEENLKALKKAIYQEYPNNNILRNYTDDQLKNMFPDHAIPAVSAESKTNLFYMNGAHGLDLMRCYAPGNPSVKTQKWPSFIDYSRFFYHRIYQKLYDKGELGTKSGAKELIELLKYANAMINTLGDRIITDIELKDEVIENSTAVEHLLLSLLGKKFSEVADYKVTIKENGIIKEITLGMIVDQLTLEPSLLKEYNILKNTIDSSTIVGLVSSYIAKNLLKNGPGVYKSARFDFCHYAGDPIDPNNIDRLDFDKDVSLMMQAIDKLASPEFAVELPPIEFVGQTEKYYYLNFKTTTDAQAFLNEMHKQKKLLKIKQVVTRGDGGGVIRTTYDQFKDPKIQKQIRYHIVKPPKVHNVEANLFDKEGNFTAFNLIKDCKGAVRSMNTTPATPQNTNPDYDWYLDQLENPTEVRPVPLASDLGDRRFIKDLRTGKVLEREVVSNKKLSQQPPETVNPAKAHYWDQHGNPIPRAIRTERGKAKNTIFAKKNSFSLIRPDGKMLHFHPGGPSDNSFLPIGFLYNIEDLHLHGERYIWRENVTSKDRFWVGKFAQMEHPRDKDIIARGQGIDLNTLQKELREDKKKNPDRIPRWNELLLGGSKPAINAMYIPQDNLVYRLNCLNHYIRLREKYGIDVPLIILDGKHPPQHYTEAMIKQDLKRAASLLAKQQFPYLSDKGSVLQINLLKDLFATITQTPKNNLNLKKISHTEQNINNMLKIINVLGGQERELKYLESEWDKGISAQSACMIRACTLGHAEIVRQILHKNYSPNAILIDKTGETALHIAIKNGQADSVMALLNAGADPDKLDKAGNTPKVLAANTNNDEIKKIITMKPEELQYYQALNLVKYNLNKIDISSAYKKTREHKKGFFKQFIKSTPHNWEIEELQAVIKTAVIALEALDITPKAADAALTQIQIKIDDLADKILQAQKGSRRKLSGSDADFEKVLLDLNRKVNTMKEALALKIPIEEKALYTIKRV